jgi:hypothetical protein
MLLGSHLYHQQIHFKAMEKLQWILVSFNCNVDVTRFCMRVESDDNVFILECVLFFGVEAKDVLCHKLLEIPLYNCLIATCYRFSW